MVMAFAKCKGSTFMMIRGKHDRETKTVVHRQVSPIVSCSTGWFTDPLSPTARDTPGPVRLIVREIYSREGWYVCSHLHLYFIWHVSSCVLFRPSTMHIPYPCHCIVFCRMPMQKVFRAVPDSHFQRLIFPAPPLCDSTCMCNILSRTRFSCLMPHTLRLYSVYWTLLRPATYPRSVHVSPRTTCRIVHDCIRSGPNAVNCELVITV
ncbi:hypothetical protein EDD15DRAFT_2294563 [Pisolithus albus]|nr:hypothetical protein EDD15DRAFT_2294563 [Pisolithus albus]